MGDGVDQREVGERLWEIAEMAPGRGVQLLGRPLVRCADPRGPELAREVLADRRDQIEARQDAAIQQIRYFITGLPRIFIGKMLAMTAKSARTLVGSPRPGNSAAAALASPTGIEPVFQP